MIYVLTEWNGKGSGDITKISEDKAKVMADRECTLTQLQAKKKYGRNYFYANDVKSSQVCSYTSKKAMVEGRAFNVKNWY